MPEFSLHSSDHNYAERTTRHKIIIMTTKFPDDTQMLEEGNNPENGKSLTFSVSIAKISQNRQGTHTALDHALLHTRNKPSPQT